MTMVKQKSNCSKHQSMKPNMKFNMVISFSLLKITKYYYFLFFWSNINCNNSRKKLTFISTTFVKNYSNYRKLTKVVPKQIIVKIPLNFFQTFIFSQKFGVFSPKTKKLQHNIFFKSKFCKTIARFFKKKSIRETINIQW